MPWTLRSCIGYLAQKRTLVSSHSQSASPHVFKTAMLRYQDLEPNQASKSRASTPQSLCLPSSRISNFIIPTRQLTSIIEYRSDQHSQPILTRQLTYTQRFNPLAKTHRISSPSHWSPPSPSQRLRCSTNICRAHIRTTSDSTLTSRPHSPLASSPRSSLKIGHPSKQANGHPCPPLLELEG